MASPDIITVFHAAEYDLFVLKRDCGFTFAGLFDTMVSAQLLGYPLGEGLDHLHCGTHGARPAGCEAVVPVADFFIAHEKRITGDDLVHGAHAV